MYFVVERRKRGVKEMGYMLLSEMKFFFNCRNLEWVLIVECCFI